ncbi:DUF4199 domain-containing protein [Aquimarina megaterium]|uniref:DUF4199 domain-containing protein n=1 Tax=Aquimarina megaterium TaxID=1443666 RepID=UPI00046FE6D1|nr:DUF4199 domain-containing protein [Aquimarina megaterium]
MEKTTISIKKHILKYGITLGILFVVYGVILYLTNNTTSKNQIFAVIRAAVLIGVIIYGIKVYKSANNGFLKLSEALKIGIGIALIGGIITIVWNSLLMNVIEPNMTDQIFDAQRKAMFEKNPNISQEQIKQSRAMVEKINSPYIMSIIGIAWNLFSGFIISLIGGAIMQKNRDVF